MVVIALCALTSQGVYIKGTSDPTVNTTAPSVDGGCGWNSMATFRSVQGVVIGKTHILTSDHLLVNTNDTIAFRGETYYIKFITYVAGSYLKVITVDGKGFPRNSWVNIYTNRDELTKECVVIGSGPSKGDLVTSTFPASSSVTISNFYVDDFAHLTLVGGSGSMVAVEWSTNLTQWSSFTNSYILTASPTSVSLPKVGDMCFYRAKGIAVTITNGWKKGDEVGGVMRWGVNNISSIEPGMLNTIFDSSGTFNESSGGGGDSGGGLFIKVGTEWKLAGISQVADHGIWRDQSGDVFYGPMLDKAGLELIDYPNGYLRVLISYTLEYSPAPSVTGYTRISDFATQLAPFCDR